MVDMKILSMSFLEAATERALKTAAQMGLFALGTQQWTQVGDVVNAGEAIGVGMLFGLVSSYLTSLASARVGNDGPSLANEALVVAPEGDGGGAGA